jgi:hypothetical protein
MTGGLRRGRGRHVIVRPGRLGPLRRLRRALSADEYRSLRRLTQGMRHLPFGKDGDALEHVLLSARDEDMELLIKCQGALRPGGEPDAAEGEEAPGGAGDARQPRLAFGFDAESSDLRPFLASLRRNGFRAMSVENGDSVTVFVEVHGTSDLEVVQAMALATSLRDLVARASGHTLRGRRAGR